MKYTHKHLRKHISKREQDLPGTLIAKLLKIAAEDKSIISLGPGEPDFDAPKPLVAYARKILHKASHYSPAEGRKDLREAICKKLARQNKIHANPENIIVTCGSHEAIFLTLMCTLDPGDSVIVPNPGFLAFIPIVELMNAIPLSLELRETESFEINPERLKKLIVPKKTKVLIINTPANPTGTVLSRSTLEEIADIVVEKDFLVLSDEIYEDLVYDTKHQQTKHISLASLNGMKDYVVTLFSFSKSYAMPGFRVGYAVGHEKIIEALIKTHLYTTLCAPTVSQLVAQYALENLSRSYIEKMRREYDTRRKFIVKRLNEIGMPTQEPRGAFYTFSNIKNFRMKSEKFVDLLLKKAKVATIPGTEFGKFGEGYIRCSYATALPKIKEAMERMERVLKKV